MSGGREFIGDGERRELEDAVPPVRRPLNLRMVVVDRDMMVLVGAAEPWRSGLSDTCVDLADHIARHC